MKKQWLAITLLFISFGALYAQGNQNEQQAEEAFDAYFELPREAIFLHLNKDTYIAGEEIWFKGYVYDRQESIPFKETSNVYVGIYDSIGRQISKKLYLAKEGYLQGNIPVDSTFVTGSYYIKAATNWMKNFKEDDTYVQKVKILNKKPLAMSAQDEQQYDVQFLPEGGNLIAEIPNTIGVKAIDEQGYGVAIASGVITDENGKEVARFGNSVLGLNKFTMQPALGQRYSATVKLSNQKELKLSLPLALTQGINVTVNNDFEDKVIITLGANNATRKRIKGKRFYLLVHRDGIARKIELTFDEAKLTNSFTLKREVLHKGINIITLFDENAKPVLERILFNAQGIANQEIEVVYAAQVFDSLRLSVNMKAKGKHNLSISVLPEETVSYGSKQTILSTFYLKPYLKGFVENPAYYFQEMNAKKKAQLDVLLLTQGWSKYHWNTILNNTPEALYEFERGITLNGTLNEPNLSTTDKVFVYPTKNHDSQVLEVAPDKKKFSIVNYFLEQGEELKVSLLTNNKKLVRPKMFMNAVNRNSKDNIVRIWEDKFSEKQLWNEENNTAPKFNLTKETIRLNEVVVTEKKKRSLADDNSLIPNYLKNKVTEVDESMLRTFPLVLDIIRARGYDVQESLSFGSTDRLRIASRRDGRPARIILDGVPLPELNILVNLRTDKIESFLFDKIGSREGVQNGRSEVIYLYSRRGGKELDYDNGSVPNSFSLVVDNGFEPKKQFYTPKYPSYFDSSFQKYGVIHWAPEVITNNEGKAFFNIVNTGLEKMTLFIEGMGEDGSVFSMVKTIQVNPNN
ncbi:hypothetical protein [Spongiimicrobium salis]|uniref:hypothetical protein n=1 Tax=Spongiimicrobium salis TaxID=1667022 RepID=UPI00374CB075